MTERPIIFSAESIEAILAGRKTQTRRVMKPQPVHDALASEHYQTSAHDMGAWIWEPNQKVTWFYWDNWSGFDPHISMNCPYGGHGDSLWVRETFLPDPPIDGTWDNYMFHDGDGRYNFSALPSRFRKPEHIIYQASWDGNLRWRSPIFMPRWASRITLCVVDVRVERLQDISGRDILAEGVDNGKSNPTMGVRWENMQRLAFGWQWDKINAKRGYSWASNPWVWVVEFEVNQ